MQHPSQTLSAPDGFPLRPNHPDLDLHIQLSAFIDGLDPHASGRDPKSVPAAQPILDAAPEVRVRYVQAALERIAWLEEQTEGFVSADLFADVPPEELERAGVRHRLLACLVEKRLLVQTLLSRQLPFTWEDTCQILAQVSSMPREPLFTWDCPPSPGLIPMLLKQLEKQVRSKPLEPEVRAALQRLRDGLYEIRYYGGYAKSVDRIDALLGGAQEGLPPGGEPWSDALLRDLSAMPADEAAHWRALLAHAPVANKYEPSQSWITQAQALLGKVGVESFTRWVTGWLDLIGRGAAARINDRASDYLKGLFWYCSLTNEPALAGPIGSAVERCLKKLPDGGLYASKAGKCGLYALERLPGSEPIAQLSRLKLRVKSPWGLEEIGKALETALENAGLTQDEADELTVPTYDLDLDGCLRQTFGSHTVEIRVVGATATWAWSDGSGKPLKSAPAAVSREHGAELKELKRTVADLEKMRAAQRDRLDRLLLSDRSWPLAQWRERYLEHPLLRTLTQRLIWHFRDGDRSELAIPTPAASAGPDRLLGVDDLPLEGLSPSTEVRLWHPIGFDPETVLRWRIWLEDHSVRQPFKQAHREIYILTDAEVATGTYSNRFAGHILKQHQFAALSRERGWEYEYAGTWDSGGAGARLKLPQRQLSAEFWVEGAGDEVADSGVIMHVSTDQVRFTRDGMALPLLEIPAVVFSEVMRDVDLFVGVAGVGNDPTWADAGPGEFTEYWRHASFGDLSTSAATRADILSRLLPRLKLRDRCRLDGRFLVVRGDLRTYRIHLGSANILMEPNDQYLCIVPDRAAAGSGQAQDVFLPFEGDRTLSIILSKAFLLAEDARITDPTILRQIKP